MESMEGTPVDLRVPTLAVPVELSRAGQARERVELFLPSGRAGEAVVARGRTAIASELATLLEAEPLFLPVREHAPGGPRVALVGKHAIAWVAISLRAGAGAGVGGAGDAVPDEVADEPSDALALYDHHHGVRVELDGGEAIDGHVLYSSPADRPRLADHLNLAPRFLRVWTATALYLVNKQHIVRVLELD